MSKKTEIIILYYEEKFNVIQIAKKLNISKQYVSKIIRSDYRHSTEKEKRKDETKIRRNEQTRPFKKAYKKRKSLERKSDNSYEQLMWQHNQDTAELSGKRTINNRAFRNWNSSIYGYYAKTTEYRIKKEFINKVSYAAPKKIKWK